MESRSAPKRLFASDGSALDQEDIRRKPYIPSKVKAVPPQAE
jgi:hypothetical protein